MTRDLPRWRRRWSADIWDERIRGEVLHSERFWTRREADRFARETTIRINRYPTMHVTVNRRRRLA